MSVTFAVSTDSETCDRFSTADPNDPSMLDGVGFDSAAPQLVSDFARGAL
jgi:60 kDa SS-A/Ro ribonucleoprotein